MSDFGSILTAFKKDKSDLTNTDVNNLSSELKKIIKNEDYENVLGEPFEHDFIIEEDKKSAIVILSEHYYGLESNDNNKLFKFVETTEIEQVNEIIEYLNKKFTEFEFSVEVINW